MLSDERKNPYPTTLAQRLRAWRLGFLSQSYLLYELDREESIRNYVTDGSRYLRFSQLNSPYSVILHDKLIFGEVFRRHPNLLPETYALLRRGVVMPRSRAEHVDSVDAVLDLLARRRRLVLKGTKGWGGSDIIVMEDLGGEISLAGIPVSRAEAHRHLASRKEHLLVEYVEQAAYAREIFPDSANSIRMLTMIDPDTGEPFLARAVHRFGSRNTRRMDNFTQGGMCAMVDPETGTLSRGIRVLPSGRPETIDRHPDTNAQITGVVVRDWPRVLRRVLEIAAEHPYLPYVGWDVVVTDDGIRLLEGNANSGTDVLQVHGPLLADPRIRHFYERRGFRN